MLYLKPTARTQGLEGDATHPDVAGQQARSVLQGLVRIAANGLLEINETAGAWKPGRLARFCGLTAVCWPWSGVRSADVVRPWSSETGVSFVAVRTDVGRIDFAIQEVDWGTLEGALGEILERVEPIDPPRWRNRLRPA